MSTVSRRLHTILHHWATAPVVLLVLAVIAIDLDRFPQWDESVFMTQTAGRDGAEAPPFELGPTREIGSVWKLSALTMLASNYPNLRLLHIVLSIAVIALAAASVARTTGIPQAVVGLVLGTYWATFAYLGQMLRFVIVAFVLLAAMSLSARIFAEDEPPRGLATGAAAIFLLGLILGPFETGVVLLCTGAYWVVVRRPWRRPVPLLIFVATIAAGSVIVLLLDTIPRYGSIAGRLEAVAALTGPTSTSAFNWALMDDYASLVVAGPVSNATWAADGALAQTTYPITAIVMIAGVIGLVAWIIRRKGGRAVDHFTALASISFLVLMAFLAGFYSHQADRYFILPGSLLLLLGLGVLRSGGRRVLDRVPSEQRRRLMQQVLVMGGLVVFAVPNVAAAAQLDHNWAADGDVDAATLAHVRAAADGQLCVGVARYNLPSVQWATGCHIRRALSLDEAVESAENVDDGRMSFVYWRSELVTPEERQRLETDGWRILVDHGADDSPRHQVWFRD